MGLAGETIYRQPIAQSYFHIMWRQPPSVLPASKEIKRTTVERIEITGGDIGQALAAVPVMIQTSQPSRNQHRIPLSAFERTICDFEAATQISI